MRFIVTGFFFLTFYFTNAQIYSKEELINSTYSTIKDSINKHFKTDTTNTILTAKSYIKKAKREGNVKEQWRGLYYIASAYRWHEYYELSNSISDDMLLLCEKEHFYDKMIDTYLLKASSHEVIEFKKSIKHLYLALELSEKFKYSNRQYLIKKRMSNIFLIMEDNVTCVKLNKDLLSILSTLEVKEKYKERINKKYDTLKTYTTI